MMLTWRRFSILVASTTVIVLTVAVLLDKLVIPWFVNASEIVTVPNVTGSNLQAAHTRLEALGLQVIESKNQFSTKVPKGQVMSQLPYAGSTVKEGRRIYLTVSSGIQTISMPSITGLSVREARLKLMRNGLQIGDMAYMYSDSIAAQYIISQSVPAGSQVAGGGATNIVVSRGSNGIHPPDVVGMTLEAASAIIVQNGLTVGKITYSQSNAFDKDVVSFQTPSPDSTVSPSTPVNLQVTK